MNKYIWPFAFETEKSSIDGGKETGVTFGIDEGFNGISGGNHGYTKRGSA